MESYNLLPETEYKEFEGRAYLNPNLQVEQTDKFIDNFRTTQQANTQTIADQTQQLGTDVPSVEGGLTGANSYWTSRYQTPQTNDATQNLRTAALLTAMEQAGKNELAAWKKRQQDAYYAQQKRAWNKSNTPTTNTPVTGGVDKKDNEQPVDTDWVYTAEGGYKGVMMPDGKGGTTGIEMRVYDDGRVEYIDHNIKYKNPERAAGADQLSDIFTGMYNYTLPGGTEVELGGWDEQLKVGSDGHYYIWSTKDNTYTPISDASGSTSGGSRWWNGQNGVTPSNDRHYSGGASGGNSGGAGGR